MNKQPKLYLNEDIDSEEEKTLDKIDNFIEDLYKMRKESISKEGEYSIGNLIFKELRNRGYLDNLKDIKDDLKSKRLSLENN